MNQQKNVNPSKFLQEEKKALEIRVSLWNQKFYQVSWNVFEYHGYYECFQEICSLQI